MTYSTDLYTLVLDANAQRASIKRTVGQLIHSSRQIALLRPGSVISIDSVEQIEKLIKNWPFWHSRPWVIAGRLEASEIAFTYDGPFIKDCRGTGYEEQVCKLMNNFDWAIFSYFATYHDDLFTFVTRSSKLHADLLAQEPKTVVLGSYQGPPPTLPMLKNASFYDNGTEGWLAYELARDRGEDIPLLLCRIDPDNLDSYHRWNHTTDTEEDFIWFEEALNKLEQVDEFCMSNAYGSRSLFKLHRAVDLDAYLALWAMASYDESIAYATLSADCDIHRLWESLSGKGFFDVIGQADKISSWAYGQTYGGGADEHHAVFHSRNAAVTQQIWEHVGASGISRF